MTPGALIVELAKRLEAAGICAVYLRNYENLPHSVGNDADVLVSAGKTHAAAQLLKIEAERLGWRWLGSARFSSLAMYFGDPATGETLHVDLFDKLAWHFLEYADASGIIARRRWSGQVFIPDPQDELYLSIAARLIYQGAIRNQHRELAIRQTQEHGHEWVCEAFAHHLGSQGKHFAATLEQDGWQGSATLRSTLRQHALRSFGMKRPGSMLASAIGYLTRIVGKMLHPPGRFLVFEGADGVGKSTVLTAVVPWTREWCAGRVPYRFHWKPKRLSADEPPPSSAVDPRGKPTRGRLPSLLYLLFHFAGFWTGWLFRIYPKLIRSHAVIGDRYSYDLFLDPRRFRLNVPTWLCRCAAMSTPRPHLTIALIADPAVIHARKPELETAEIAAYQDRWSQLRANRHRMISVAAEGSEGEVLQRVKSAILSNIAASA